MLIFTHIRRVASRKENAIMPKMIGSGLSRREREILDVLYKQGMRRLPRFMPICPSRRVIPPSAPSWAFSLRKGTSATRQGYSVVHKTP